MKVIRTVLSAAAIALVCGAVTAQDQMGWLGTAFEPDKCLQIQTGEYEVRRKLCTIRYEIERHDDVFIINGIVDFNPMFVPKRPQRIDLEVLLIDDRYVCRRQINLQKAVGMRPVVFSVTTPKTAAPQYIRTYYTLYYQ